MYYKNRSRRLSGHDYCCAKDYHITINAYGRKPLFSSVHEGIIVLTEYGALVLEEWKRIREVHSHVHPGIIAIMPDHLHGILHFHALAVTMYTKTEFRLRAGSLGAVIGQFKSRVTKRIRIAEHHPSFAVWQHNYHDHIIRDHADMQRIRKYILRNPMRMSLKAK